MPSSRRVTSPLLRILLAALALGGSTVHAKRKKEGLAKTLGQTAGPRTPPDDAECIVQADFDAGTKIIDAPGKFKLCEDIIFSPNAPNAGQQPAEDAFDPIFDGSYDENAFGLGFFAAIAISAPDVELYLNGRTIEQSIGHALFQRFFAVIELADSPFIKSVGPAEFVGANSTFGAATNVQIHGPGVIGRSSHHGIHGNENSNVAIQGVAFRDFEVAAVSLNNVDSLLIEGCEILRNRKDVPVVGLFSAARFIRPYGKALKDMDFEMNLRGSLTKAAVVYERLIEGINNVYQDVVESGFINPTTHHDEFELFNNPFHVVDGPCYAFVVHGKGPAVGGYGFQLDENSDNTASNIVIKNNNIKDIQCWTNEVPAAVEDGVVINDARGAIFQFVNSLDDSPLAINPDGTYKGNLVADMQIMVAKAINDGLLQDEPLRQTGVSTIGNAIINWAMNAAITYSPSFRCNGDSMHHVSKGIVVIRVEDTVGFEIAGNVINNVDNLSPQPFGTSFGTCADFHAGASVENTGEQQGGNVRAISVSAVEGFSAIPPRDSFIKNNIITNIESAQGNMVCGIDVQGKSKAVEIDYNVVDLTVNTTANISDGKYVACRVRQFTDGQGQDSIDVRNKNVFDEEVLILNRRRLRKDFNEVHRGIVKDVNSEWDLGGCPFARAKGQKAKSA